MNDYKDKLANYKITLQTTAGCGKRAQCYINNAYQDLSDAHLKLTPQEKIDNPLPEKEVCKDDGYLGFMTGAFSAGRNLR